MGAPRFARRRTATRRSARCCSIEGPTSTRPREWVHPAVHASQNGHKEVCALLLDRGANATSRARWVTPLYAASQRATRRSSRCCSIEGPTSTRPSRMVHPLYTASWNGHKEVCALLLDQRGRPRSGLRMGGPRCTPQSARRQGGSRAAAIEGPTSTRPGWCTRCIASTRRRARCCRSRPTPTRQKGAPRCTARNGHKEVCALLLDRGPTSTGQAEWVHPAVRRESERPQGGRALLLDRGATRPGRADGCTPLYIASQNGHKEVCALLLDRGANVDQARMVHPAVHGSGGHKEVCALLPIEGPTRSGSRMGAPRCTPRV